MGSKQGLVLLCCISLLLIAAPRLPYLDGGRETLFSLLWLGGLFLHMTANVRHMKMMFLGKRNKKIMQHRFRTMQAKRGSSYRQQEWRRARSVTP